MMLLVARHDRAESIIGWAVMLVDHHGSLGCSPAARRDALNIPEATKRTIHEHEL